MKKAILISVILLLGALVWGQEAYVPSFRAEAPLCSDYDLDSTSYIYVRTIGPNSSTYGGLGFPVGYKIKTSGSSTSVTTVVASAPAFLNVVVGDELYIQRPQTILAGVLTPPTEFRRYVATKTDSSNITVNTALDLTAEAVFYYRTFQAGTAATDGWVSTRDLAEYMFEWQLDQSDGASIDVQVQCETIGSASVGVQVFTKNYTAYGGVGSRESYASNVPWDRCRLGFKITTDTSDAGANIEKISGHFRGWQRVR